MTTPARIPQQTSSKRVPRTMLLLGMALIAASSLAHLWLEIDRGLRIAPELKAGPEIVARTHETIGAAQNLDRALQAAERAQRTYLITRDAAYLQAYRMAVAQAPGHLARLRDLTRDNAEQQRRMSILETRTNTELGELGRTLELAERDGMAAARKRVLENGPHAMQAADEAVDAVIVAERALLSQRLGRAAEFEREGRRAALVGGLLALAVVGIGVALVLAALRNLLRAEASRRESEERFGLFARGVTDYAIYPLDPKGFVTDWNAGAERIKGYRAEEIVGQHFSRFYTEEDRASGAPERALEIAAREGKFEKEGWRVRKDGTRFLASVIIDAIRDPGGRIIGFTKITRDISVLRQQQEALAQYAKIDALGQLTGGIAHDFNNLIHVIKNGIELLQGRLRAIEPDVQSYLDMVRRNADRAASLTQRLLTFSRRQMLEPKPINPNGFIGDLKPLLAPVLGERISLETVLGAGVWWFSADSNQLETAILNLALNARDAMPQGGKLTIEVTNAFLDEAYAAMHQEVKPGQYVMIAVSDSGRGMTKETVAKAFDPFFTTKQPGHGTGLGLSQVFGFIKQSGGHAKIYSEPGEGTTVKLYLPRLLGTPVAETAPKERLPEANAEGETILVVEDEADVRHFIAEMLRALGYRVLTAEDGPAALRLLDTETQVDLLFTDVGLPGLNGREVANEALKRRPALKVLFTTGYARNAIIHQGRLDPGVELIAKPFTQSTLASRIRRLLD